MLVLLAAATLAAAPPPADDAVPAKSLFAERRLELTVRNPSACKAAGRMQTRHEPALLFREKDRLRARRLTELPRAEMCLVGEADDGR